MYTIVERLKQIDFLEQQAAAGEQTELNLIMLVLKWSRLLKKNNNNTTFNFKQGKVMSVFTL